MHPFFKTFLFTYSFFLTVFIIACTTPEKETERKRKNDVAGRTEIRSTPEPAEKELSENNNLRPETVIPDKKTTAKRSLQRVKREKQLLTSEKADEIQENELSLREIYASLDKPAQIFELNSGKDTVLIGTEGTRITVPAGIWQTVDKKKYTGPVRFELKEYYRLSDMLLAGLTTSSDGAMLETGGMLNLKAFAGNEELQIGQGKDLKIEMPAREYKEEMELFYGEHQDNSHEVNWKQASPDPNRNIKQETYNSTLIKKVNIETVEEPVDNYEDFNSQPECARKYFKIEAFTGSILFNENGQPETVKLKEGNGKEQDYSAKVFKIKYNLIFSPNLDLKEIKKDDIFEKASYSICLYRGGREICSFSIDKSEAIILKRLCKKKGSAEIFIRFESASGKISPEYLDCVEEQRKAVLEKKITGKTVEASDVQNYIFSVSRTGWINCDRFYGVPEKCDFIVQSEEKNQDIKIIFKNINSVLPGSNIHQGATFRAVPKNADIKIVAVKTSGSKIFLALKDSNTRNLVENGLQFEEVSLQDLKEKFKALN